MKKVTKTRRAEYLTKLSSMVDLSSGRVLKDAFVAVDELFDKSVAKGILDKAIYECSKCPEMNIPMKTEAAPGWGNLDAKVFIIGQSLCTACMATQIPFTRGSGYYIDAALKLAGLTRYDIFITNVVHCHPQKNRKSDPAEIKACLPYLIRELSIVKPEAIVLLGGDAKNVAHTVKRKSPKQIRKAKWYELKHPAYYMHKGLDGIVDWTLKLADILRRHYDKC